MSDIGNKAKNLTADELEKASVGGVHVAKSNPVKDYTETQILYYYRKNFEKDPNGLPTNTIESYSHRVRVQLTTETLDPINPLLVWEADSDSVLNPGEDAETSHKRLHAAAKMALNIS